MSNSPPFDLVDYTQVFMSWSGLLNEDVTPKQHTAGWKTLLSHGQPMLKESWISTENTVLEDLKDHIKLRLKRTETLLPF